MKILGIDTATPIASVALIEDGDLCAEKICGRRASKADPGSELHSSGRHAEVVLPLIEALLQKAKVTVQELTGLAVSIGPGSFTGLRIGLATAKGIAYESGLPLVGISTLHANAARVSGFEGLVASLLDARKGEVYVALFRRSEGATKRLTADSALSLDAAISLVRQYHDVSNSNLLLVGDGAKAHEQRWRGAFEAASGIGGGACYPSIASQVAMLATEQLATSLADDVGGLTPVYLRSSEAERKRKNLG